MNPQSKVEALQHELDDLRVAMAYGEAGEEQALCLYDRSVHLLAQSSGDIDRDSARSLTHVISSVIAQAQLERQMCVLGVFPRPLAVTAA
jgi:hypothetical protein